ncbi:MAG TPA: agmatinase [Candidatus Polarisedimenticolaceae bacterium]|nr:agmatinase [Candidatus Polarisedimenticolaceae bacterium]
MADSIINCADPARADVVLIGAGYDGTSSFGKGADRGPAAVRDCLDHQIEFDDRISGGNPAERLAIAWVDADDLAGLPPAAMVERLERRYRAHDGRLRVLVGGEHSISNAAFRAWAGEAGEITVVQIDAHADLRDDDSDYNDEPHGRFAHCSVMRRAHEAGYRLCQIGIRAYSAAERELFDDPRITVWEWGREPAPAERIVDSIATERVYLTLDVDGLDPALAPATGTPVPGGLGWYQTTALLRALTRRHRVVAADVVEVCPRPGDRLTEYAAAQLIYSLIGLALPGR